MSSVSDPTQVRRALLRTAPELDPPQEAAVRLLVTYNRGTIIRPAWAEAFVSLAQERAYVRWDLLDKALNRDPELLRQALDAVLPYSPTEQGIMRLATDMALDRWNTSRYDQDTRTQALLAIETALLGSPQPSPPASVNNSVTGSVTGGFLIQAGEVRGHIDLS